jgi:hypothetical protein
MLTVEADYCRLEDAMWMVYLVIYGLYSLTAIAGALASEHNLVLVGIVVVQQPFLVLATYCYTFRRRLLPGTTWRVFLLLSIVIGISGFIDVLFPSLGLFAFLTGEPRPPQLGNPALSALSFAFDLPALYATYRLGNGAIRGVRTA